MWDLGDKIVAADFYKLFASEKRARPLCLDFGVIGRECRLSDGGIPYNPSPYNKETNNRPTQSEQV